jgi:hypothetical protein
MPCRTLGLAVLLVLFAPAAHAQSFINQTAVTEILDSQQGDIDEVPDAFYEYYVLRSTRDNTVQARNTLYYILGQKDMDLGKERAKVVGLLNRRLIHQMGIGDTLVIPTRYDVDFRAYSPFPRYYPGAKDIDKLFIIHKTIQAFAAYEHGKLVRWGIVNTGAPQSPTPTGRYNFNWKTEYKISSLSPPDEPWEMWWVFNFHEERGIHIHQFAMPTGGPQSHGCVRMLEPDAMFIYNWADAWRTDRGDGVKSENGAKVFNQGSMVLVIGDDPETEAKPFAYRKRYPVLQMVELPESPYDIPPGTRQQERFDKLRASLD